MLSRYRDHRDYLLSRVRDNRDSVIPVAGTQGNHVIPVIPPHHFLIPVIPLVGVKILLSPLRDVILLRDHSKFSFLLD